MKIEQELYSADNIPDEGTAGEISALFMENYPAMCSEEIRKSDLARYDCAEKIQQQASCGNFFIVYVVDGRVVGFTKFRLEKEPRVSGFDEWLLSWMIIAKPYRQLKFGIAQKMFNMFEELVRGFKKTSLPTFLVADVHADNRGSIFFCKRFGFTAGAGKSPEYLLFRKEVI